ncbi:MAG TPA: hypothetical protein VFD49_09580 [Candidatus Dormibacteraeota bacterium]|nr:hypothetical protein [Candidatus Dormibacteraeota bacterium]
MPITRPSAPTAARNAARCWPVPQPRSPLLALVNGLSALVLADRGAQAAALAAFDGRLRRLFSAAWPRSARPRLPGQ